MDRKQQNLHLFLLVLALFGVSIGILHGKWRNKVPPSHHNDKRSKMWT